MIYKALPLPFYAFLFSAGILPDLPIKNNQLQLWVVILQYTTKNSTPPYTRPLRFTEVHHRSLYTFAVFLE